MNLIIGLLSLVFVVLAITIVRKSMSLTAATSDESEDEIGASEANKWNGYGFLAFLIALLSLGTWSFLHYKQYFRAEAASDIGVRTDNLFWIVMAIITLAFAITSFFLFYFAFKYRYRKGQRAFFYTDNHTLEIIWTTVPAVIMAGLVITGYLEWKKITYDAPDAKEVVTVEVTGKQFNWIFRYPGNDDNELGRYNYKLIDDNNQVGVDFSDEKSFDDIVSSELHMPKGKKVLLLIRARDVLHSVYLPDMRAKMDAVPGMQTKFWFVPTKTTEEMRYETKDPEFAYKLNCTEVCGGGHFSMAAPVVVETEAEFKKWLSDQKSLLATYPEYINRVPSKYKEKALKYAPAPAADSTSVAMTGM
jgi:cytochrome c oxidase subunit II